MIKAIAVAYVGCLCCDSYTPVIASMGLLCVFILMYSIEKIKTQKQLSFLLLAIDGNISLFYLAQLFTERSGEANTMISQADFHKFVYTTWTDFFFDNNVTFLGLFSGIVLVYVVFSILGQFEIYDIVISVWTLGVVLFAFLLKGYTEYAPSWVTQRCMIVIPVLIVSIFGVLVRFLKKHSIKIETKTQLISLGLCLVVSLYNFNQIHRSFLYFTYVQDMKYAIEDVEDAVKRENLNVTDNFNIIVITDNGLQSNIKEYAKYFFPNANTFSLTSADLTADYDAGTKTIVIGETMEEVKRFTSDAMMITSDNPRYDDETVWYVGVISGSVS